MRRRSGQEHWHYSFRARLVDGLAADLRPSGSRPADSSAMDYFARRGFDCWSSTWKAMAARPRTATTTRRFRKAPTIATPPRSISRAARQWPLLIYGISSGALRAAMFAERHPEMVARLRSTPWCGPAKARRRSNERRKKLPEFIAKNRRPIDKAFIHSIFDRDHPGTAEHNVIELSPTRWSRSTICADRHLFDMCSRLPVVNPEKITVPTLIMRGHGTASPRRRTCLNSSPSCPIRTSSSRSWPGISHASFQQKNYMLVYHILQTSSSNRRRCIAASTRRASSRDRPNLSPRYRPAPSARGSPVFGPYSSAARYARCAIRTSPPRPGHCCGRRPSYIAGA